MGRFKNMKEITKDYVCQYELSKIDEDLEIDERAEKYNKKFYREIVAKEKSRYADLEKTERKELKKAYKRYYKSRAASQTASAANKTPTS